MAAAAAAAAIRKYHQITGLIPANSVSTANR